MRWFIVRNEGDKLEYVGLADLEREAPRVPIFGAEKGDVRVVYDRILARRGLGPFFKYTRRDLVGQAFSA